MAITQRQQKFLLDRLQEIRNTKPRHWDDVVIPDTPAVKRAMVAQEKSSAIIDAHKDKQKAATKARREAIDTAHNECRRAIMFTGDPAKALKALDDYEATQF